MPNRTSSRIFVPGTLISDVIIRSVEKPKRVFLLLHGYSQSGEKMYARCENLILKSQHGDGAFIIAPNGPYPMALATDDGWKVRFSWYFHDPVKDDYFIDMENPIALLKGVIEKFSLQDVPTTVIGFSQGGYLAPFFAEKSPQVDHVIGVGCEFLKDEMKTVPPRFRMDAVHGDEDGTVSMLNAKRSFDVLASKGTEGKFLEVKGEDHGMTLAILAALKTLV